MLQQKIKQTRVLIDALAQLLSAVDKSAETVKSHNELLMAKAFLGKVLGEIGNPSPYKNDGKRKTVADIEPVADSIRILNIEKEEDIVDGGWNNLNHIEKIDWLRQEIAKLPFITVADDGFLNQTGVSPDSWAKIRIYLNEYHVSTCKARFWLGFELQRIRETSKQQS